MLKLLKKIPVFLFLLCYITAGLAIYTKAADLTAHITPDYKKADLTQIFTHSAFTGKDYAELFLQTGLGKSSIDKIRNLNPKEEVWRETLLSFQEQFFENIRFRCEANSIISREEVLIDEFGNIQKTTAFAPLENGDILITTASHTIGWRNGHAALVIDAENGKTLESVVLGENSCIQSISKWQSYPNFIVLRLKNTSKKIRAEIAASALSFLNDIPYDLTAGIFSKKDTPVSELTGTQCAHLIWSAYYSYGYDIDSNGGILVIPQDLVHSPLLEVVQVYGLRSSDFL